MLIVCGCESRKRSLINLDSLSPVSMHGVVGDPNCSACCTSLQISNMINSFLFLNPKFTSWDDYPLNQKICSKNFFSKFSKCGIFHIFGDRKTQFWAQKDVKLEQPKCHERIKVSKYRLPHMKVFDFDYLLASLDIGTIARW